MRLWHKDLISVLPQKQFMDIWKNYDNGDGTYRTERQIRNKNDRIGDDHRFTFKARVFRG